MQHELNVLGAQFSPDVRRILSWSDDGTARLWSATNNSLIAIYHHASSVTVAKFDFREQRVLTISGDTIRIWDISLDRGIPLEEHILELGVRSATKTKLGDHGDDGGVRILSEGEWAESALSGKTSSISGSQNHNLEVSFRASPKRIWENHAEALVPGPPVSLLCTSRGCVATLWSSPRSGQMIGN